MQPRVADRYPLAVRVLHWLIAALLAAQLVLGFAAERSASPTVSDALFPIHFQLGVSIALLMTVRLFLRLALGTPRGAGCGPRWASRIATGVHALLYLLVLALPVSGYVIWVWMGADRSMPGGWVVPALFVPPEDDETGRAIAWYVHTYGAGCLLVLAGLHVAAAAWHPWLRNDRLIARRMGFGGRSGSGTLPRAMNPSPPTGAGSVDDPPPLPPEKPLPNECCESGCPICVLDVYAEALVEYRRALAEWKRRHPDAG